jgi:hypothetical protein
MCSGPPPYYNLINRQAGRPSSPSEDQRIGFSIYETTLPAALAVSGRTFAEPRHEGVLRSSLTGQHSSRLPTVSRCGLFIRVRGKGSSDSLLLHVCGRSQSSRGRREGILGETTLRTEKEGRLLRLPPLRG